MSLRLAPNGTPMQRGRRRRRLADRERPRWYLRDRFLASHAAARRSDAGAVPRLALADICRLPFRDSRMDLVMAALVLEHVPRPS